ncbi:MAG: HAD family hydrolase [Candidatus Abyssobacteria bacterium SURF_5]|uniref:HAD family hydrolase n=1 Tax=Abyssobacteria bacterium (strain SURF_5) TaxID=2093360 RepID=A0A3A4P3P9_ABYX5|nr:MAG: HAD family hydrolase [Candidatus Abyssubacteria bacterium SURF_5]
MKAKSKRNREVLVVLDADNTLWDTDLVYAKSQLILLSEIEKHLKVTAPSDDKLSFLRRMDQNLARLHNYNLEYPARLLINALALALTGHSPLVSVREAVRTGTDVLGRDFINEMEMLFIKKLKSEIPPLRIGVRQGVKKLHQRGGLLVILTEGNRDKCKLLLNKYELSNYIHKILVARKEVRIYQEILAEFDVASQSNYMVGDQLDRDIAPAKEAGFYTIYFAGGFQPFWMPAVRDICPHFTISSFEELPHLILANNQFNLTNNYKRKFIYKK